MPSTYQCTVPEQPIYTSLLNTTLLEGAEYFDSIREMNPIMLCDNIIHNGMDVNDNHPYLKIIEEPADTFRYRYKSEKGSHGGIKGRSATRNKKSFPTVKLENCPPSWRNEIVIKVSLYTNESEAKPHVYELTGKNCSNGNCEATLKEDFTAVFQSLAISTKKREEVLEILKQRKIAETGVSDEASLEAEVQEELKSFNLDSAKLCFEVFINDDRNNPLCEKIFSKPINNQKSTTTGDLKIFRLSRCSGKCTGEEEVILLCDKIKKDDIKVRFFEKPEDGNWEDYGEFNSAEVHHQVAIIFKTPRYYLTNVHKTVYIELLRPSDDKRSDPRQFEYTPDDDAFRFSNRQFQNMKIENLIVNEIPENSKKRKLEHLTEDFVLSSVMDSPQSTEEISYLLDDVFTDEFLQDNGLFEFKDIEPVCTDSVNQISSSMNSLLLVDQICEEEVQAPKIQKSLKDFMDGMRKILQNREDYTYFHYAPSLIPMEDENGNNMLHLAILEQNDNLNLIKTMLEMISEDLINRQNKFKETPLHLAVKGNNLKILLLLLTKGGDPNIVERNGNNCLHLAAKYGHINSLKVLMLSFKNRRKHKVIRDINAVNYDGMSTLHIAITRKFEDCVTFLLNCKADINLPEKKGGLTSLHLAIEQPSLLQAILKLPEIDIDAKDFRGYTALQLACQKIGKPFEKISAKLKEDKHQIIKFLENYDQNGGMCDSESNCESTCSSDFEDAIEDLSFISCETVSAVENKFMNEKKSSLMKTEEELFKYLDTNDNWKKLAELIGLDAKYVAMFDKGLSPGLTVLRKIKDLYHPCELQVIIEMLKLAGLEEGVHILQKDS